ncbi:MAG TPA: four helix bundle protein [Thermoanaerobaculia bacterium]
MSRVDVSSRRPQHRINMKTFEDLRAFQRAVEFMVDVYAATKLFPKNEMYGLTSQMRRAACSVVSNIAEGQGRLTYGEWRQMLSHSRGSLYQVQAQIIAATRLGLLSTPEAESLKRSGTAVGRELAGLIVWVTKREKHSKTRG